MKKNLYTGRLGRLDYFFCALFLFTVGMAICYIPIILASLSKNTSLAIFFGAISFVLVILYTRLIFSMHIRRLHDVGMSGWFALLFLVPLMGLVFFVAMLFKKGDEKENEYGTRCDGKGFFRKMLNLS